MNVCIVFNIQSILSPKSVFLKLWVGMHNEPRDMNGPLIVYGFSGGTTRAKDASAPLPFSQVIQKI